MRKLSERHRLYLIRKALIGQRRVQRNSRVTIKKISRYRMTAPEIMDFDENYDTTTKFISKLRRYALVKRLHVFIDMSFVQEIAPDAALVLAAEIQRCMAISKGCINGKNPKKTRPMRLLRGLKFHELLGFHSGVLADDNDDALEYIHMECGASGRTDFFPAVLKLVLGSKARPSSTGAKNRLTEAWNEALANATQHGYENTSLLRYQVSDNHRWWMAGYRDTRNKEAIFMVYDQGVTIPADLPLRWSESFSDIIVKAGGIVRLGKGSIDDELLMNAMTVGRTRRTDQRGRGWGFNNMHALLGGYHADDGNAPHEALEEQQKRSGGSLRILSRRGRYLYHSGAGAKVSVQSEPFWGTLIVWRLKGNDKIVWSDE